MADEQTCPLTPREVADQYFLEHRAKVLDVAAFFDRIDRAGAHTEDFRIEALKACIAMLIDGESDRTRRIQERLSDSTTTPIDAAPMQGAMGAPPPETGQ